MRSELDKVRDHLLLSVARAVATSTASLPLLQAKHVGAELAKQADDFAAKLTVVDAMAEGLFEEHPDDCECENCAQLREFRYNAP